MQKKLLNMALFICMLHSDQLLAATSGSQLPSKIKPLNGAYAGDASKAQPVVMVKVNGQPLSVQDYTNFLQRNAEYVQAAMTSEAGKAEAVRAMVGATLIHAELVKHPEWLAEKDKKNQAAVNAAYQKLAAEKFPAAEGEPAEEKVYAYYQTHPEEFGIPEMVRVSQIQFVLPEKANEVQKADARNRAEAALKRVEAGEDFGTVATQLTENKLGRLPRGDLGFIGISQGDWLRQATQSLNVGEHSKVLESPAGYEILLVTDRRPAMTTPYANVRAKVIQIMKSKERRAAEFEYMKSLAKSSEIEIIQPDLKALFPKGVFPE